MGHDSLWERACLFNRAFILGKGVCLESSGWFLSDPQVGEQP